MRCVKKFLTSGVAAEIVEIDVNARSKHKILQMHCVKTAKQGAL